MARRAVSDLNVLTFDRRLEGVPLSRHALEWMQSKRPASAARATRTVRVEHPLLSAGPQPPLGDEGRDGRLVLSSSDAHEGQLKELHWPISTRSLARLTRPSLL